MKHIPPWLEAVRKGPAACEMSDLVEQCRGRTGELNGFQVTGVVEVDQGREQQSQRYQQRCATT